MPDTPPLWFTRTFTAQVAARAREGARRAADAWEAGTISAADWRDLVVAAVTPAMAVAARLSRAAEFGLTDRADLFERVAVVRSAANELASRLAPRDPAARGMGLTLAGAVRATAAAYERAGRRADGPAWERRIAGPGCPPECRVTRGAWRPAGELPTPGDCLCRLEYFSGTEPPVPVAPVPDRVSFRVWTAGEIGDLSEDQLSRLSPDDAADAIEQLGSVLDDSLRSRLEGRVESRAVPPNPQGNHFSDDRTDRSDPAQLSFLVAAPDPAWSDLPGVAERLVRSAQFFGVSSRTAYRPAFGGYGPNRRAVHERLASSVLAVAPADGQRHALVVVGAPCSGKTRAASRTAGPVLGHWATVCAMTFAEALPEYQGWNRDLLADEAGDVAALALEAAIGGGRNVVYECHGREPDGPGAVAHRLASAGYLVHGLAVNCPAARASARAAERFAVNPFGLLDPTADPSAYTPTGSRGTVARDLAGYPGLSSWAVTGGA